MGAPLPRRVRNGYSIMGILHQIQFFDAFVSYSNILFAKTPQKNRSISLNRNSEESVFEAVNQNHSQRVLQPSVLAEAHIRFEQPFGETLCPLSLS